MGKKKQPKVANPPTTEKVPRIAEDPDPRKRTPVWRFQMLDLDGPFGWRKCHDFEVVMHRLRNFETMKWSEIIGAKSHVIPVDQLGNEAQVRLQELRLDDLDNLVSLRITQASRVFGILDGHCCKLLWWDPEHDVYPMNIADN
jgi:hypothetical protein